MEFEAGDWVVCVNPHADGILKSGAEYEVKEIRKIGYAHYLKFAESGAVYSFSRFKHIDLEEEEVEEEEIDEKFSEFSVGDRFSSYEEEYEIVQLGGGAPDLGIRNEKTIIPVGAYEDSDYIWVKNLNNDASMNGFNITEVKKAKEQGMYHCGNCGEAGHNQRTCPNLKPKGIELLNKDNIQPGDIVTIAGVEKPENESSITKKYNGQSFKVQSTDSMTVVCDSTNTEGKNFGEGSLHFSKSVWKFSEYQEGSALEEEKKRTIWELAETILPSSRLTLLYGPPGTGKTTAANFVPDEDGTLPKVYNITLTEETPAAELRGHFIPKGTEFIWMHGPAMSAFIDGGRLVLNEIDKASGDALTFCHALLDDPGIARITLPTGDTLHPHENFKVVATMNGHPDDLPEALRDRFAVRINIDKLHPEAIKALPKDLRKAAAKGISKDSERSVSVRGWKAFATLREVVGEEDAALAVFGERAETVLNTIKISRAGGAKKAKTT